MIKKKYYMTYLLESDGDYLEKRYPRFGRKTSTLGLTRNREEARVFRWESDALMCRDRMVEPFGIIFDVIENT